MANMRKISAVALFTTLAACAFAQTATTTPVGFMKFTIAGGTPTAPATTAISVPLHDVGGVSGLSSGAISAIGATTITVNSAGWTAGALSVAAIPYAVCIKSGVGEGATLKITANTDSVLTVEVASLSSLGVVAGDRFEIIPLDTLWTFFGSNTLLGGTSATDADVVYLSSGGAWVGYYFNTSRGFWVRTTGATSINRNDTTLQPASGILIERRAAATEIVATGTVPSMKYRASVANSGNTLIHSGFPTDVTLGSLAVETLLPGWVSNSSAVTADWLYVMQAGAWVSYYNNGAHWRRTTGPDVDRSTVSIPAGSPILLFKKGTAVGATDLNRALPYSL